MDLWFRILESGMDKTDIKIVEKLMQNQTALQRALIETASRELSKELNLDPREIKRRIEKLMKAEIFRNFAPIIDPMKIWNYVYFIFVKADLSPPLIGVPIEYPSSWSDLIERIKELRKKSDLARTMIRYAFPLQGTEWDILLLVTTNERENLLKLCNEIVGSKFVEKIWSFSPVEGAGYVYEPIVVPQEEEYERLFADYITKGAELIGKRVK